MDVIEGKALQVSDAIISCQLDGKGGMIPIAEDEVIQCEQPCWLHLNYTHRKSAEWLQSTTWFLQAKRQNPSKRRLTTHAVVILSLDS